MRAGNKYRAIVEFGHLRAPAGYLALKPDQIGRVCNGCGPQKGFLSKFVSFLIPNSLFGLSIKTCCNIHDFCYIIGLDKCESDLLFYRNMVAEIEHRGGLLRKPRLWLAGQYYLATRRYGNAYYKEKRNGGV